MAVGRLTPFQGIRGGAWLGWKVESNWTDPFLFAGYSIVKPLAQSLILAMLYLVVQRRSDTPYFAAMMVGNAFFMVIGQVLAGVSWCIVEDREFYGTIRFIYVASRSLVWYTLGRSVAKSLIVSFSVVVVLLFARFVLGAPLTVEPTLVVPGAAALMLGMAATAAMGLGLAGVLLVSARYGQFYSEAVAGSMFLLAGAVFPVELLPAGLRAVSFALPQTYWLEAMRRVLSPSAVGWSPSLAELGWGALLGRLAIVSVAWGVAGLVGFKLAERWVRFTGTLDARTES